MSDHRVTHEELRQALQQLLERLESDTELSGDIKLVALTDEGLMEHTISVKTPEERAAARIGIRRILRDMAH